MTETAIMKDVDDTDDLEEGEEGGSNPERRLVRLLVGGRMRRNRRLRRLLLAHLLKERMEGGEEDEGEDIDDEGEDEGSERARKLVGLLVVGRMRRHRQLRRLLAAHLARENA